MSKERLHNLIERLKGDALATAELELSKLVPAFAKINFGSTLERDFRLEGYDLPVREDGSTIEDVDLLSGEVEFDDPVSFLKDGEKPINGEEMVKRAITAEVAYSQMDGQRMKNWFNNTPEGKKAREQLQGLYLPLAGAIRVYRTSHYRCVACLCFVSEECFLDLRYLDHGYGASDRFLPRRKP